MTRPKRHYSPQLDREVVRALYHEAKRQGKPMTRLANEVLSASLARDSPVAYPHRPGVAPAGTPRT